MWEGLGRHSRDDVGGEGAQRGGLLSDFDTSMACVPSGVSTARPRDRAVAIPPTGCPGGVAMLAFKAGPFTLMVKGPVGNLHVAVAFRALDKEILANKIQRWLTRPFSDKILPLLVQAYQ